MHGSLFIAFTVNSVATAIEAVRSRVNICHVGKYLIRQAVDTLVDTICMRVWFPNSECIVVILCDFG